MPTTREISLLTLLCALIFTGCGAESTGKIQATSSSNASATAQTTEHYSGGSKAPEGEYRPADEHGPAQNVPKPTEPEGMNVETTEGMELFINYWNDLRNYAMQTGDTTEIKKLVDKSYMQESDFYDSLDEIYTSGGWVIGGMRKIYYNKDLIISNGDGIYSIGCNFEVENLVLWSDGKAHAFDNSDYIYNGIDLQLKFEENRWVVLTANIMEQK